MKNCFLSAALLLALSVLGGAHASAQLIDDFNSGSLSGQYLYTPINDGTTPGVSNNTFSITNGMLMTTQTGTTGIEQGVLLRNDFSLTVGKLLTIDVAFPTQAVDLDFGIAVSATKTPTAAATGATDTRQTFQFGEISVRPNQNAVRAGSYNGTSLVTNQLLTADETTVGKLFIERNSSTLFTLGYFDTTGTRFNVTTVTFSDTNVGNALGFYSDLRASGATLGSFDNLQIVPEPSSVALMVGGCAALGAVGLRRRRRA